MVPSKNVNVGICLNGVRASNIEFGAPEMQNYGVVVKLFWRPSGQRRSSSDAIFIDNESHSLSVSLTLVTVRFSHASSVVIHEVTSMMDSVDVFDDDDIIDIATEQQK